MQKLAVILCALMLVGCTASMNVNPNAPYPAPVSSPYPAPDMKSSKMMDKNSAPGVVVVVPPEELRELRGTVQSNTAEIEKLKTSVAAVDAKATRAMENTNTLFDITNKLWAAVADLKESMSRMFDKILKK